MSLEAQTDVFVDAASASTSPTRRIGGRDAAGVLRVGGGVAAGTVAEAAAEHTEDWAPLLAMTPRTLLRAEPPAGARRRHHLT